MTAACVLCTLHLANVHYMYVANAVQVLPICCCVQACQDESRSLLQITQVTNCIQQTMSAASVRVDGGNTWYIHIYT